MIRTKAWDIDMTLPEAIATLPSWIGLWLNVLMLGGFILPVILLIWRESRWIAICALVAGVASAYSVGEMFEMGGYTKLLGLPHILFYTPLVIVLWQNLMHGNMSNWPHRITWVVLLIICISLAFDYIDVLRFWAGDRLPLPSTI